ncbi:hypothetical protein SEVIR_9G073000v4 [Setaria viridis]|uniref:Uncharacterized protein n=2 Tax=Setaria TaxID=4554 RepID=K4ADR2_SETIT|nr:uncharacterized protein LOC101766205 [Setaria italica]XP_004981605.1 uncharacterized protein LOC101766205 [Setaria italica]XP_034573330.1 uncharacterized protein LOC117837706 [Setaria viridis]XP_034573332.1 uncharacterized protein LOC117837706 [Setaria viridis]XP_034573333.1 uncharacterized protein LOC117837706 [Setaria viridis]RCV40674.1 hypothetical protein SETIT_9G074300v2 [Setaria italica]RCV40675.1 hypothetical protein SETIT_9G074300v2 [Setaria italica]TKV91094.1 hypothetical protein
MLRQSPSRSNNRSKKLRPSHTLEAFLLVAVGVWIAYQVMRSYGKQRVVAVETDVDADGKPARRWLGRKGFVGFAAGQASADDDIVGIGDGSDFVGRGAAGSSDDRLSQARDAGDEEDQEAGEDDGVDSDADDVAEAADEEEDGTDFLSQSGNDEEEMETAQGQAQNGINMTVVPPVNATDTVQDGGAVLPANATGGAADGTALTSSGYPLKNNNSSADLSSRDRGAAGDASNKLLANNGSSPGENHSLQINKNETAGSVAGHGISSRRSIS